MKIVNENFKEIINIHKTLNETMEQAKAVLKKSGKDTTDEKFRKLKDILEKDNKLGYIGQFTKWLYKDNEDFDQIIEVYEKLKEHRGKVPAIHSFKTLEDLYDFLQSSEIDIKVNQLIKQIPSNSRKHADEKLKKLLASYIKYYDSIKYFYSKKGGRFENPKDLYNDTKNLIENLEGDFSLEGLKRLIKEKGAKVNFIEETPDMLIVQPLNFETSTKIGSTSWCISTSESYWNSYVDLFTTQYFIYDFTKNVEDRESMIGVTINPDGSFKAAHFKNDNVCPESYLDQI